MAMIRRKLASLLLLLAVAAVLELLAFGFFRLAGDRFSFPDPERYLATGEEVRRAREYFDRDLGWVVPYDTPFGERPRQRDYGRPLVSAFGDSFTHGDEVGDDETWPEQLAGLLAADVYNYGASAYGMDQALLRMEHAAARAPTPVHVLAFMSYDIERNVCVYWKFLAPEGGLALTKPRFFLAGDGLELWPNPVASADDLAVKLRDEDFLRRIGERDFWYDRHGLPGLGFPYLLRMANPAFVRILVRGREVDLWKTGEAREISERILVRFDASSRARGARALFVHLPVFWEITAYLESGKLPSAVEELERICAERGLDCYVPLLEMGELSGDDVPALFTRGAVDGHYNRRGNGRMAAGIARALRGLLPAADEE